MSWYFHGIKYISLIYIYIYMYIYIVFANGPGDLSSIPDCNIPKTLKMVLDTSLLNTQQYKVCIKGQVEHPGIGVVPSLMPQCCSYQKGNLLVTLD